MLAARLIAAPVPGTVIDGRYRVERPLGMGGMGAVVAATHLELQQEVAIKVLLPAVVKSKEANARFLREGRAAARLTSPYAAKVFDTGRLPSGEPYLVMELLSGRDLREHMTTVRRVSIEQAVEWVLQAAHALGQAHKLNVIHRDVKPANLFLATTSEGPIIKVLDFGVSKQVDDLASDLTNTASILGTPRYMAPEQMRSARLADPRCDIWSLGVVLYELTTGESPFRGDSVTALCFDVMERTPIPPSRHDPELPPSFDAIVARCLAKDPDERFPTMESLAEALRAFAPSVRHSLLFGSADGTPTPEDRSAPQLSSTPAPTVGLPMLTPVSQPESSRQGLQKWLVGAGIGVGLTAAVAIALTLAGPGAVPEGQATQVRATAAVVEPSAPTSQPVVAPTTTTEDHPPAPPIEESGPEVLLGPTPPPSVVDTTPTYPEMRGQRLPPGLCNPPTWKDKNNRLVPKPYCL